MEKIVLNKREITGGKVAHLLKQGIVAAVVYNEKAESFNVQITVKEANWLAAHATSTTILDAELDGKKIKTVVKDFDFNPITDEVRHVSFFQIDENKEMIFTIPFKLTGISPAVKNNLGILVKALPAVDVKCKLADLVSEIEIDISNLEHPGQTISMNDIALPKGMTLPNDEHAMSAIVTITQLQKLEEELPTATPAEGEEGAEAPAEGEATGGETTDKTE
ncbi:MAG: 50S ribosomal protein L25 [candidate division WS6 bacterium GW2011_GWF2_39_15]|uniref:Large ribosomal subunit protein bL25 n=1 Tax=candidate division WS6 bacterium GW2011_GWF2_39_15 TaxID=1619100 RepID=A0A0G0QV66_9BACT|nr:MAG: 50S ribosomal protein L25 [candidate division WS6 bacterium GW2011_GWF2_39_15]